MSYNRISDTGAYYLLVTVLSHPALTVLNLSSNIIMCTSSFTRTAIYNLLRYNKSLSEIIFASAPESSRVGVTNSQEVIMGVEHQILGALTSSLRKIEWGDSVKFQAPVADRLAYNAARTHKQNGAKGLVELHKEQLDMGYSGYIEISMRDIEHNLQGRHMPSISSLLLDHNILFQLSESIIKDLKHLHTLQLSHNRFEILPSPIKLLTNLVVLDLSYNKLKRFPKEVLHMVKLQELDLSFNSIHSVSRDVTSDFGVLTALRRLALHRNNLTQVPLSFFFLPHLSYLLFVVHWTVL